MGFPWQRRCTAFTECHRTQKPALRRTLTDAGLSTYTAKNNCRHKRPFKVNENPVCTPEEEEKLRKDDSYPSGHTALGWAWALVLAEIAPDRADAVLARGRAFGESRIICNVHWHSDVVQGRFMGGLPLSPNCMPIRSFARIYKQPRKSMRRFVKKAFCP